MHSDRIDLYAQLEEHRKSQLIVYVTGDRRGMETQVSHEVMDFFVEHLDLIDQADKISLYLYTPGGTTLAAWSIVHLIRQYCTKFEVIVPTKALSAGTLICLGADNIVMTKQATLGPIDPSVNTPLNPAVPGASDNKRMPVSVEEIIGFIELAREEMSVGGDAGITVLSILSQHVHPLVLGNVYRTRSQIRMLGRRLLLKHIDDEDKIEKILAFLCSDSGSHDYTIYRQEARDELGLDIVSPDDTLYEIVKRIYDDVANELQLNVPYSAAVLLGTEDTKEYVLPRALIESRNGGSYRFVSEGRLTKQQVTDPKTGAIQEGIQDRRTYEGWKHESIPE